LEGDNNLATYKHDWRLEKSNDARFDEFYGPGDPAPYPGIYRCVKCGHEIATAKDHTLPSQDHDEHKPEQGKIIWQLIVSHK
jgi:hypothetical protein